MTDREPRRTKLLDEELLKLGHRLRRFHIVIVGPHHVERTCGNGITPSDEIIPQAAAKIFNEELTISPRHSAKTTPHVVVGLNTSTEAVDQLTVPTRRAGWCAGRR